MNEGNTIDSKFQKGGIVTALSFLCKYHDPDTFGEMGLWKILMRMMRT